MTGSEIAERARLFAAQLDAIIAFAEQMDDHILAAKLAHADAHLQERYLTGRDDLA